MSLIISSRHKVKTKVKVFNLFKVRIDVSLDLICKVYFTSILYKFEYAVSQIEQLHLWTGHNPDINILGNSFADLCW